MKKFIAFSLLSLFAAYVLPVIDNVVNNPQYMNHWDWVNWFDINHPNMIYLWFINVFWVGFSFGDFLRFINPLDFDRHPSLLAKVNRRRYYLSLARGYHDGVLIGVNSIIVSAVAGLLIPYISIMDIVFQTAATWLGLRLIGVSPVNTALLSNLEDYRYLEVNYV